MNEKELFLGCRNEKEFNALEKILKSGKTRFNLDQLRTIIEAYEDYNGNASKASEDLGRPPNTTIKYWRIAGFEIKKCGRPFKQKDEEPYLTYKRLLEQGHNQSKIARELGVSRQAVNYYTNYHPELREFCVDGRRKYQLSYEEIKRLIAEGKHQNEIARELEVSRQAVYDYIKKHPELRKGLTDERKKKKW